MKLTIFLILAICIVRSSSNIWDNIYSQTNADTPIIVSQSLNFQFQLRDNFQAKIDFNSELGVVTAFIYLNLIFKLQIVRAQLDLASLVVTITRQGNPKCERYNIAALKNVSLQQTKISGERLFLLNIFFKFISKSGKYNIYKLQPFLFTVPESAKLKQLQEEINKQTDTELDIDQDDFIPNIPLFLHVNSANGNIEKIFTGEKQEKTVPFRTSSVVKSKAVCEAQVHSMGTSDLKQLFEFVKDQRNK